MNKKIGVLRNFETGKTIQAGTSYKKLRSALFSIGWALDNEESGVVLVKDGEKVILEEVGLFAA